MKIMICIIIFIIKNKKFYNGIIIPIHNFGFTIWKIIKYDSYEKLNRNIPYFVCLRYSWSIPRFGWKLEHSTRIN